MINLFTYGSLMCADIMLEVSGQKTRHQAAHLNNYFCSQIHNETYPGITPVTGERVSGVVYFDLNTRALEKLDAFEGEYYERKDVDVQCSGTTPTKAMAYIIKPEYRKILTGTPWSFEDFLQRGKKEFETHYIGFTHI